MGPDDGSVEPKRYSVDFSINIYDMISYIYIYIYIYDREGSNIRPNYRVSLLGIYINKII